MRGHYSNKSCVVEWIEHRSEGGQPGGAHKELKLDETRYVAAQLILRSRSQASPRQELVGGRRGTMNVEVRERLQSAEMLRLVIDPTSDLQARERVRERRSTEGISWRSEEVQRVNARETLKREILESRKVRQQLRHATGIERTVQRVVSFTTLQLEPLESMHLLQRG